MTVGGYENLMRDVFARLLDADALSCFRDAMRLRAEEAAREIVSANDTNLMHGIRGQISICYELADGAQAALDASKECANSSYAKGIRNGDVGDV